MTKQFGHRPIMRTRNLDLNDLVLNLAKILQRMVREDVKLELNLHSSPLMTRAVAGMLEEVVVNLFSIANDAMPNGGRLQVETAEVSLGEEVTRLNPEATPGRYVSFSVSDNGGGIPSEVLPTILKLLRTSNREGKGEWMRLENVAGIVKQHRGLINLENRSGEGATFHVFLPASLESVPELMPSHVKPDPRRETIILVEEDVLMRKTARMFLERHGYQVWEASNGMEAFQCLEERPKSVSLLLTNLELPGTLSGQELARQLLAKQPELKVIYLSAWSSEIARRDFQMHQEAAFIQKPYPSGILLETIRRHLDG